MDTDQGFPITAIREIKILSSMKHENIVNLREIVRESCECQQALQNVLLATFCQLQRSQASCSPLVRPVELCCNCITEQQGVCSRRSSNPAGKKASVWQSFVSCVCVCVCLCS